MGKAQKGKRRTSIILVTLAYALFTLAGALLAAPIVQSINSQSTPRLSPDQSQCDDEPPSVESAIEPEAFSRVDYRQSEELARARQIILEGMQACEETIDVSSAGLQRDMVADVYHSILDEEPSTWHVSGTGHFVSDSEGRVLQVSPQYLSTDAEQINLMRERYEEAMAELLASVPDQATDIEKVRHAHDWIIDGCSYNNECSANPESYCVTIDDNPYGAYSAMVQDKTVCRGYALAFKDACRRMGIECEVARTLPHEWNKVRLDGRWYNIDLTFDDRSRPVHNYDLFLKSDAYIREYDLAYTHDAPHIGAFPPGYECEDTSLDDARSTILMLLSQ